MTKPALLLTSGAYLGLLISGLVTSAVVQSALAAIGLCINGMIVLFHAEFIWSK